MTGPIILTHQIALGTAVMSLEPDRDRRQNIAVIRAAADDGLRIFDAARVYAPRASEPLYSEALLAEALDGRGDVLIATKGGHFRDGEDFAVDNSPRRLRADVDDSLRALHVERIPLYYLHRADDLSVPIEESVGALAALRESGVIERIGVSNVTVDLLERARAITTIDAVQNLHSASGRESAEVVDLCERVGIPFFAYSPLRAPLGLSAALPHLAAEGAARGVSVARLALRALLESSPVMSVVSGASRLSTVHDSAAAAEEPWDDGLREAYRLDVAAAADAAG